MSFPCLCAPDKRRTQYVMVNSENSKKNDWSVLGHLICVKTIHPAWSSLG
nr:MAG TPA: hypothetical protein [Herelleviridae sp.]